MKYDDVTFNGLELAPGEPFFILRGQDVLAPGVVEDYAASLEAAGATAFALDNPEVGDRLQAAATEVREAALRMRAWQSVSDVKIPD